MRPIVACNMASDILLDPMAIQAPNPPQAASHSAPDMAALSTAATIPAATVQGSQLTDDGRQRFPVGIMLALTPTL